VTVSFVSAVEVDHISGKKFSHAGGQRLIPSSHQQMKMVRHERPGVNLQMSRQRQLCQTVQKISPIYLVSKNPCPFDPTAHNMVQSPGCIKSGLSWHDASLQTLLLYVKLFLHQRPLLADRFCERIKARNLRGQSQGLLLLLIRFSDDPLNEFTTSQYPFV